MSQALYRKWRPQTWDQVVGQEHVIQTLQNALTAGRIAHAYLFAGPRGTGKTTTARLLAKAVNCLDADPSLRPCDRCTHCQAVTNGHFLDLIEIDAASNTSVEDVRDLRDKINFSPNQGRYKVYIIDEVHMLSQAAFNALLKTLEEPPAHAIFVLATTEVHKIPATVLSRCQRHEFRRIPLAHIVAQLKVLAKEENIQVDDDALVFIARQSTGAMRDAISLLDQLASTGQVISLETAQEVLGMAASQSVLEVVNAIVDGQSAAGLDSIHTTLDGGSDPRQYARQIVDYLRGLLLVQSGNPEGIDATSEVRAQMARHSNAFTTLELLRLIRLFNEAANEARTGWQPALPLEMAFLAAISPPEEITGSLPAPVSPHPSQAVIPDRTEKTAVKKRTHQVQSSPVQKEQSGPDSERLEQEAAALPDANVSQNDQVYKRVMADWRQVLQQVGLVSRQTQALLNSCKPYGVKDGVLFLGFNGDFAKSKMEQDDNIEVTCQVLSQVMGKEMPIRCFIASGNQDSIPPDVDSDGMVAAALRDLGGEVVDIQ
jgi:DNA polymerase-3 subunit gamma/tau